MCCVMTKIKQWENNMTKKVTKSAKVLKMLQDTDATDKRIASKIGCSVQYVKKLRKTQNMSDAAYKMTKGGKPKTDYNADLNPVNTAGVDPNAWTRSGILNQAEQYVIKDRAADHGDMEDNFRTIADLWTAYLGFDLIITDRDVAAMMTLLKIARSRSNPDNADNWIDACGYMACGGELATQKDHK